MDMLLKLKYYSFKKKSNIIATSKILNMRIFLSFKIWRLKTFLTRQAHSWYGFIHFLTNYFYVLFN